jgi:hypothetical protein
VLLAAVGLLALSGHGLNGAAKFTNHLAHGVNGFPLNLAEGGDALGYLKPEFEVFLRQIVLARELQWSNAEDW